MLLFCFQRKHSNKFDADPAGTLLPVHSRQSVDRLETWLTEQAVQRACSSQNGECIRRDPPAHQSCDYGDHLLDTASRSESRVEEENVNQRVTSSIERIRWAHRAGARQAPHQVKLLSSCSGGFKIALWI